MYKPKLINGQWLAFHTKDKTFRKDINNKILVFQDEQDATLWCNCKNKIDNSH